MGNLGTPEIILIFLVILIFFGGKKIPEIAQSFGKGLREFRKASREIQEDIEKEIQGAPGSRTTATTTSSTPPKTEAAAAPMTTCPSCKASNPAGSKFCSECGTKLA